MTKRQLANKELVDILYDLVIDNPDLRFSQILHAFNFVDNSEDAIMQWKNEFYVEPEEILKRVKETIK